MLRKLMKYELAATGRILIPIYFLVLAASAALAANARWGSTTSQFGNFLDILLSLVFVFGILAMIIVTTVLIIQRFYKNLLGNEGYLMFSLPVSTWQNILSKALSALLWIVGACLTGIASGFIFILVLEAFPDFWEALTKSWNILTLAVGKSKVISILILFIAALLLAILESIVKIYASFSVGHLWGNHRVLGSILGYIGFGAIESLAMRFLPFEKMAEKWMAQRTASQTNGLSTMLFGAETAQSMQEAAQAFEFWRGITFFILAVAIIGILIYGGITCFLLDRHLNLE
ncbi:MAG: hypothetical protein IKE58_07950 [Blautia sp.]|nr:hypothetical protein [Blautia sp.]